jgi:mycothiol synthase
MLSDGPASEPNSGVELSKAAREIRSLRPAETNSLSRIQRALNVDDRITAARFAKNLGRLLEQGGRAWIVRCQKSVAGYASILPAPGLPGLYELDGFIAPSFQRQGLATFLLGALLNDLTGSDVRQLYHPLSSTETPAAHFLAASGFYREHEELVLTLDDLRILPPAQIGKGYALRTLARDEAISRFRRLYELAFAGLPWYQPYESDQEVAAELADAGDLLFLDHGRQAIGFLWLRWPKLDVAEIEPVGVLPGYRGRGFGRQIMLAGLNLAAQQSARKATVGVWTQNAAALALYERLGFHEATRKLFVAYDLA